MNNFGGWYIEAEAVWLPFADDIFNAFFLNKNVIISIKISEICSKGLVNNVQALVQIMAWRRPGDKPLSEPMKVCLLTHACVTRINDLNQFKAGFTIQCHNRFGCEYIHDLRPLCRFIDPSTDENKCKIQIHDCSFKICRLNLGITMSINIIVWC